MRQRLTAGALGVALLLLAVCTGLTKIRNPDYWWHLRIGYWIAETRSVPRADFLTYTVPGAPYVDIHWLFQLGLAAVHSLGGHPGVVVAKALLVAALVAILATVGRRPERPFVAAFGLGLMLLVASDRFLVRPEMPSFVLLASVLALLERNERRGDAWVYAIVPLQIVWVNLHGLFALGIALCGLYGVAEMLRCARGVGDSGKLRRLASVTGLVVLAALLNPRFVDGALYPLQQLGMITPSGAPETARHQVREIAPLWQSGFLLKPLVLPALLAALSALALAANWRHNRSRQAHGFAFLALLTLGLLARRNLALFAIVAAPLFVRNANEWLDRHPLPARVRTGASAAVLIGLLAASVDVARGSFYWRVDTFDEPGLGYVEFFVPEGAVDWIERERPPGPIAHDMWLGGYLSWRLYPDYLAMLDGRLEVYGPEMIAKLSFRGPRAFQRLDSRYHFGGVLLNPSFDPPRLIAWLQRNPNWRLVYADVAGALFVRPGADGPFRWPEVDVNAPGFLAEGRPHPGAMDYYRERARERLLLALRSAASPPAPAPNPF